MYEHYVQMKHVICVVNPFKENKKLYKNAKKCSYQSFSCNVWQIKCKDFTLIVFNVYVSSLSNVKQFLCETIELK